MLVYPLCVWSCNKTRVVFFPCKIQFCPPRSPVQCTRSNGSIIPMKNHSSLQQFPQPKISSVPCGRCCHLWRKCYHLAGVSTFVFGVDDKLFGWHHSTQPVTPLPTHLKTNIQFMFLLPAELLDCLRAATCCSLVSLVMLSSSSSDRASAISPHLFNQRVSVLPRPLFSLWSPALPRENGVDSQHRESQQHDSSVSFSRR